MRRLVALALVAATIWYGYRHWSDLRGQPRDEAVIQNDSGREIDRVRLTVGDQTIVREVIPAGRSVTMPFAVTHDATFALKWQFARSDYDWIWSGGLVTAGPIRTRHHFMVEADGGVICTSERIPDVAK